MAKAVFYQKGEAIDYRPENDVAAGEVIVQGDLVGITRLDIPAGRLGSIAVCGVFKVAKKANDTFSVGAKVYWNGTAATTTTDDVVLGLAVADSAAADADVLVLLNA
jgi:predicted RecA/RadA family phage recombinase